MMREILEVICSKAAAELGLPRWEEPGFAAKFERAAERHGIAIAKKSIERWVSGGVQQANQATAVPLAQLCRLVKPHVSASWFLDSRDAKDFAARWDASPDLDYVQIAVPRLSIEDERRLRECLCGLWVTYRYSFAASRFSEVARELLLVRYADGKFPFTMWYVTDSERPNAVSELKEFSGYVLPYESSLHFVAASDRRGRALFVEREGKDAASWRHLLGILASNKQAHTDRSPVAACTVLVKHEVIGTDSDAQAEKLRPRWCTADRQIVGVDEFDSIVKEDFGEIVVGGKRSCDWIKLFMDNTPLEGRNMPDAQPGFGPDDTILSLNLPRFRSHMAAIRVALEKERRQAPFLANWKPLHRRR
jgi:hypothetical protein